MNNRTLTTPVATQALKLGNRHYQQGEPVDVIGMPNREVANLLKHSFLTLGALAVTTPETATSGSVTLVSGMEKWFEVAISNNAADTANTDDPPNPPEPDGGEGDTNDATDSAIQVTQRGGGWFEFFIDGEEQDIQGRQNLESYMAERGLEYVISQPE